MEYLNSFSLLSTDKKQKIILKRKALVFELSNNTDRCMFARITPEILIVRYSAK